MKVTEDLVALPVKSALLLGATLGAGCLSGILYTSMTMAGGNEICWNDADVGDSPLTAPLRSWRRQQKALEEVSTNPWTVMFDPEYARVSYLQQTAPWRAAASAGSAAVGVLFTAYASRWAGS